MTRSSIKRFIHLALALSLLPACFGPSDMDRIATVQSDLVLLIEGKDSTSIIRHCPDDLSSLTITMDSGGYTLKPESLSEIEDALAEFQEAFNAEEIDLTQQNVDLTGDTARVSLTFRISDEGWERMMPVRLDLAREGDRWVLRGLHLFN